MITFLYLAQPTQRLMPPALDLKAEKQEYILLPCIVPRVFVSVAK